MEDIALWNLMLKGDMMSLEVLYRRHYELLLNYGLKYCTDEEMVKDAIQDLFVKLCNSSRLSSTDYVRSYLLKSLRNILFDKLSSLKVVEDLNELSFELTVDDTYLAALFKDNDEELLLSKKIMEAYKSLSDNQREAIYLRYIKGLSYKEVAVILDINPQSSMNLVSRALTKLRMKIADDNYLFIFSLICLTPVIFCLLVIVVICFFSKFKF